jgi:hypothetical protein
MLDGGTCSLTSRDMTMRNRAAFGWGRKAKMIFIVIIISTERSQFIPLVSFTCSIKFHLYLFTVLPHQQPIAQIRGLQAGETRPYLRAGAVVVARLAQPGLLAVLWQLPRPSYVLIGAAAYSI